MPVTRWLARVVVAPPTHYHRTMNGRNHVIAVLAEHLVEIRAFGVREIALFGSTARDEARPTSDVDLLVDFEGVPTFRQFMGLRCYLEDLLGLPIDVADREAVRPPFRSGIESEARRVA